MSDNPLMPPGLLDEYQRRQMNALAQAPPAGSMFDRSPDKAPGLLVPGNIDIHARPVVRNADGSISTVRSLTFTDDQGRAVLIPTVIPGRGVVPNEQAIQHYYQTGQHLGIFEHPDLANTYAQALHEQQAAEYVK
jgi:hypothetical protein